MHKAILKIYFCLLALCPLIVRVIVSGDGISDTLRCWTLIDDFSVDIYDTDSIENDGEWIKTIPTVNKWCHLLHNIKARINAASLHYFNPITGDQISIAGEYPVGRNNWSANPSGPQDGADWFIMLDNYWLKVDVENPYWEDSWYKLTVKDQFGLTRSDSVFNETIEPHADFTFNYIRLDDSLYYPGHSDNYYDLFYDSTRYDNVSAPALYKFKNRSVNAQVMTWYFGDGLSEASMADSILHTYQLPGSYAPVLVVSSTYDHLYDACTDTLEKLDSTILIGEASIANNAKLPNVFSCPDGENNLFRFLDDVSITEFEIAIYNRYGKRVHHFKGDIRDWEGWDGRDKNTDRYVQTGVYYYVVKEMEILPEYETGRKVRLAYYYRDDGTNTSTTGGSQSGGSGQTGNTSEIPKSSIYYGFVHVYNTE